MRRPKPWFRKQTKSWYVQIGRQQIHLSHDKKEAWQRYHDIMADRVDATQLNKLTARHVLGAYLDWCEKHLAGPTFKKNCFHVNRLVEHLGENLLVREVKPLHVQEWIDHYYAGRSDTYKNIAITTIKAAMNWAVEQGYLDHSPIARIRKPRAAVREFYLPVAEWRRVLNVCRGQQFIEYVTVLLSTGARPQELRIVEARHYEVPASRFVFSIRESKGKLRRRVIYLDDTARAIVERLIAKYPAGPLFRNSQGRRWTSDSINSRFRRLKAKLDMPELCAYALRHSYAHWKLTSDTDSHLVAKLLGHTDGRMLHTRYGHVDDDADFMLNAVLATRSPLAVDCKES